MITDIIVDLEATCWNDGSFDKNEMEIIEIGAVALGLNGDTLSKFDRFVKPSRHPELSDFCKELTTITQKDIDNADYFPLVIKRFQEWINGIASPDYRVWSWGLYDRAQFNLDCSRFHISTNWLDGKHYNLSAEFKKRSGKKKSGIKRASKALGIELEGTPGR